MSKEKEKKPIHKKWWFWLIAVLVIGSWIVNDDTEEVANEEIEQIEEETNDEIQEPEEEKSVIETLEESRSVDEAAMDGDELVIVHNPGTVWSENSFMNSVYDTFAQLEVAFSDDEVESVLVMIETTMTDEKGNESLDNIITYRYTRADFEELNYVNFKSMAMSEEWRILNEAESYFIHPGIRNNLKDKYTNNLK